MNHPRLKKLVLRHVARLKWWPVVAALYFVAGKLGLLLAMPPGYATPVWPPSGLALGLLLVLGWEVWPGVMIGSFLVNATLGDGFSPGLVPLFVGCGAATAALTGYMLTRRMVGLPMRLEREREVMLFFGVAAPLSCVVSTIVGVATLLATGLIASHEVAANALTWWLGDTLGVMTFTPFVLLLAGKPREVWVGRRMAVGLPLILGFAVAVSLFVYASSKERRQLFVDTEQDARFMAERFSESTSQTVASLYSLDGFHAGSKEIDRREFEAFTRPILEVNQALTALAWVPVVRGEDVEAVTALAEAQGYRNWRMYGFDDKGNSTSVLLGKVHYPVFYSARRTASTAARPGFDLASDPVRLATMEKARDTGKPATTGRVPVVVDGRPTDGIVIAHPIYAGGRVPTSVETRRKAHLGFYTAVFRIEELVASLRADAKERGLEVEVHDEAAKSESRAILNTFTQEVDLRAGFEDLDRYGALVSTQAKIVDRTWQIRFLRPKKDLVDERSLETWLLLAFGLAVCTILGGFLMVLTGRAYRTERLVEERTRDLTRVNQHNAAILSVLPDSTMRVGRDGTFREVLNSPVVFAERTTALVGRNLRDTYPDLADPMIEAIETALDTGTLQVVEMQTRRGEVWHSWEVRLVKCGVDDVLTMTRDITAAKTIHEAMASARDEAIRANKARGAFVANMSHEIRTPMNGILGMATLLAETPLTADQIELVHTIQDSGKSLLSLINDILDFSKLEHGKTELEARPFSLRKCVVSVVQMFRLETDAKALEIVLNFGDDVPEAIKGDELRLRQVLVNLVGNAVKFTPRGRVSVIATAQPRPSDPGQFDLRMSVEDSGIGIPAEKIGRLFKAFSQADASTTREHGGTGLGLVISRSLVELMGGRIEVTSEAGIGSVFSFEIPVAPVDGANLEPDLVMKVLSKETLAELRILVAEDNLTNQKLIKRLLAKYGVQVTVVSNGADAVTAVASATFDLVLMDLHMPVLDGFDAVAAINAAHDLSVRPMIVILSADVLPESRQRCEELGIAGFLTKPIRVDAVEDTLRRAAAAKGVEVLPLAEVRRAEPKGGETAGPRASFDEASLLEAFKGDEEILRDALAAFLASADQSLDAMRSAIASRDARALEHAAHSFKGAVGNFRALPVTALAQELESLGRSKQIEGAEPLFAALELAARELFADLARFAATTFTAA